VIAIAFVAAMLAAVTPAVPVEDGIARFLKAADTHDQSAMLSLLAPIAFQHYTRESVMKQLARCNLAGVINKNDAMSGRSAIWECDDHKPTSHSLIVTILDNSAEGVKVLWLEGQESSGPMPVRKGSALDGKTP
jgi:hypothetical protein